MYLYAPTAPADESAQTPVMRVLGETQRAWLAGEQATGELLDALTWERVMLNAVPDGMLLVNEQGRILLANAAMLNLAGYSAADLVGQSVEIFLPPHLRAAHAGMLRGFFRSPATRAMGVNQRELKLCTRAGVSLPVDISLSHCQVDGEHCVVAFVRDLSSVKNLEDQMHYLATHDSLTGLVNRWQFKQHLEQTLALTKRSERTLALLLIDLDDFKLINDGHGHAVGDMVLIEVAIRLRRVLRAGDVLARLGGDEFTVALHDVQCAEDAQRVADKLLEVLSAPYPVGGYEVFPGASIGIACAPGDADDAATLMRYADMAMYQAKTGGRHQAYRYQPELGREREALGRVHDRLQQAIKSGGLELHYQPQVGVLTGEITGVEALLRWHDEELGHVPPAQFVAVAERTGLMLPLGDWVLETACRQLAAWQAEGLRPCMAINLSVQQLRQPHLCERLAELLQMHGLAPQSIELEITESEAMSDPEQARRVLARLSALGVRLALDDFGTGHSSLSYLRLLPIDRIKIDRSFMAKIHDDEGGDTLVRAILALAHTLGQQVVAEGVETPEQLEFLRQEGCSYYQGWLFAKALPVPAVRALLLERAGVDAQHAVGWAPAQ